MRSALVICSVLFAWLAAQAQWDVPVPVVLDGTAPADRQVTGVASPTAENHGANMEADRYRSTTFGTAQGMDALTVQLTPSLSAYVPGMRFTVMPSAVNTGATTINIDGLGAVPVRKLLTQELDSADLQPGVPVEVIYDGAVFQVCGQLYKACPAGFKSLGREACVEAESHDAVTWYAAGTACIGRGLRMCSFGEWVQACLMTNGIFPNVSDYEWVDSAANFVNDAKTVGLNADFIPDCRGGSRKLPTQFSRYRCCSDR